MVNERPFFSFFFYSGPPKDVAEGELGADGGVAGVEEAPRTDIAGVFDLVQTDVVVVVVVVAVAVAVEDQVVVLVAGAARRPALPPGHSRFDLRRLQRRPAGVLQFFEPLWQLAGASSAL